MQEEIQEDLLMSAVKQMLKGLENKKTQLNPAA